MGSSVPRFLPQRGSWAIFGFNMAKVSLVIRCRNESRHIGRLLSGVAHQTVKGIETIVVDSGSTDNTLEVARKFPVRIVTINPKDFSFGHALNRGCTAASGDYIVFASAHTYPVYDTWVERLIAQFADPEIALAYGRQRGNETTRFSEHQIFAKWFPAESIARQNHPFCNNANAAIRRDIWAKMPYDERLTGLEDLDWAKRAMAAGRHISYVSEAPVVHVHEETHSYIANRYRREAIAHKQIMPGQRFTFLDFLRLFAANTVSDYVHALKIRALAKNFFDIPSFRLMQFWGTYRGFAQHGPITKELRERFYYPRQTTTGSRPAESAAPIGNEINYDVVATKSRLRR